MDEYEGYLIHLLNMFHYFGIKDPQILLWGVS